MKVIDLLNKIANGELEENTRFYDKYVHKEYIFKPKSYAGIYPEGNAKADENWYLTLQSGTFRLIQEIELIEDTPKEDKKIEKLFNVTIYGETISSLRNELQATNRRFEDKINEIIDKINGE